jgi:hypothetical protein
VVQSGRRLRLAPKTLQVGGIDQGLPRQHLEGDVPAERHLLRLVDQAHAAATNLAENAVIAEGLQRGTAQSGGPVRAGGVGGGLELLHDHQGGEQLADLLGRSG